MADDLRRRGRAALLFLSLCVLLQFAFLLRIQVLDSRSASSIWTFLTRTLGSGVVILLLSSALTRQREPFRIGSIARSLMVGTTLGATIALLSQANRWIVVDPEWSSFDASVDIALWLGAAFVVAFFEEAMFRRFFDVAFSTILGPWAGALLQIGLFVSSHHPSRSPLFFQALLVQGAFAVVATQSARILLGLTSAIGLHFAADAARWLGFGTHEPAVSMFGANPLHGVIGMQPASDWAAYAIVAALIGCAWLRWPRFWGHRDHFQFRWNLRYPTRRLITARERSAE